ncbi:MAG: hypothetical protein OXE94_13240 [Aestuariivita sp.]|nr:hypothetical protein [Aestuariivita sp.]MCY4204063.1 hypothetical protein [Aestuariivita sp.]MCY4290089.1 hypothetical protein [Aestuariivita sp.]MCY4347985.1 hypothetical protein [Aestuariivita sp.]
MQPDSLDQSIFSLIDEKAKVLEDELNCDVIFYHGQIHPALFRTFRDFIEAVKVRSKRKDENCISVVLRTAGGSAETTERMVGVLRKHYKNVNFIVPDVAMSAGTIFCMSGDRIFMDYSSSLGPVDPQVQLPDTGDLVPALGYIDKIAEIAKKKKLSPADVVMLKSIDLAKLALFEQGRDLSTDLLKDWLVRYKFKDWKEHRTTNPGTPVTEEERIARAKKIALELSNHKRWRSHGRNLNIEKLQSLKIEIDDYSDNAKLSASIRGYNDPMTGFIDRNGISFYLHNRNVHD